MRYSSFVAIFLVIVLLYGSFIPEVLAESEDERLTPEAFMEKYTLAETLELGVQPVFRMTGSRQVDDIEWFNLTMTHVYNRDTGLRLGLGYLAFDAADNAQTIGRLRQVTFRATMSQNLAQGADMNPYFGFGLNFYRTVDEIPAIYNQEISTSKDAYWGLHVASGFRYLTQRSLSFSLDIYRDWMMGNMKIKRTEGGTYLDDTKIDLGMWTLGINMSLRF